MWCTKLVEFISFLSPGVSVDTYSNLLAKSLHRFIQVIAGLIAVQLFSFSLIVLCCIFYFETLFHTAHISINLFLP